MKQVTAVDWLEEEIGEYPMASGNRVFINAVIKKAKEMEKQQIIDAMEVSQRTDFYVKYDSFEDYYNEQFKNK